MECNKFYSITPLEFRLFLEAQAEKENEQSKALMSQAYVIAVLSKADPKKMPSYEKFMSGFDEKESKPKNDDELLNKVMSLNAQFGGEVNGCN